ncbi:NAD(P)-binding protein [Trichoderma velutinum]
MATFTQKFRTTSYPTISSSNPLNSQAGRTVLITGGSEGIGFAIASAFTTARASRVILLGRRKEVLQAAQEKLIALRGKSETAITTYACDVTSLLNIESTWKKILKAQITVDILVLNAGYVKFAPLARDIAGAWPSFELNVLANLHMTQCFLNQTTSVANKKFLINVSTCSVHSSPAPHQAANASSKAAFASLVQNLADELPASQTQIVSYHPGAVLTEGARSQGYDENTIPWDNASLPGDFAVWLATDSAKFLHGKFVWSNWDVDELLDRQSEITKDAGMLRIGLQGTEFLNITTMFEDIKDRAIR